jgi:hypothetical protein
METMGDAAPAPRVLKFRCPACGRKFATKPELAGQKVRCSKCGAGVRIPWADEDSAAPTSQPAAAFEINQQAASAQPVHSDGARVEVRSTATASPGSRPAAQGRAANSQQIARETPIRSDVARVDLRTQDRAEAPAKTRDPEPIVRALDLEAIAALDGSGSSRRAESVLSSRSELMDQVRQQVPEEDSGESRKKPRKSRKKTKGQKKKKYSSYFDPKETLKLVAGVGALVGVLAFLAWGYPEFRFPLGGFLCVVGFIVYLLGSVSLRQLVAEEGALKALLFRFCPPYQWWFVATHWDETKDFVAFFVAGAVIMSIGGGVIKVSPTGKKAEASERAYQKMLKGKQAEAPPPVTTESTDGD